jgi:hypothetical protein
VPVGFPTRGAAGRPLVRLPRRRLGHQCAALWRPCRRRAAAILPTTRGSCR